MAVLGTAAFALNDAPLVAEMLPTNPGSAFVGGTCYGGTKHAVMGFSESLMLEVRDKGVKVSVVNPGSVATEFFRGERDTSWMLTAEDVADAVHHAIDTPPRVLVHRIEVRASAPKKG